MGKVDESVSRGSSCAGGSSWSCSTLRPRHFAAPAARMTRTCQRRIARDPQIGQAIGHQLRLNQIQDIPRVTARFALRAAAAKATNGQLQREQCRLGAANRGPSMPFNGASNALRLAGSRAVFGGMGAITAQQALASALRDVLQASHVGYRSHAQREVPEMMRHGFSASASVAGHGSRLAWRRQALRVTE